MNFVSTGCQAQHCIVVDMNGIAYSFGKNNKGQLGVGDFIQRNQPVVMAKLDGKTVISAACGKSHSLIGVSNIIIVIIIIITFTTAAPSPLP